MNGEVTGALAERVAAIIENQRRPMTTWEVAIGLGGRHGREVTAVLKELTASGRLARFRAGLNQYYAHPRAALTEDKPLAGTVVVDSVKGLVMMPRTWLAWRFNVETTRLQTVSG